MQFYTLVFLLNAVSQHSYMEVNSHLIYYVVIDYF